MPTPSRAQRFPAAALMDLIETRPFDLVAWTHACSPDLHLRIANGPVHTARSTALDALRAFFDPVVGIGCGFHEVWQRRDTIHLETDMDIATTRAAKRRIPCVLVARTTHGLIRDMRFHLDPTGFEEKML